MSDAYDQILQAAQSYAKQRTATNPWAIGTQAVGALPEGNFDNPWINVGISALKGFGTGYMGGMAQNSQNAAWADAQTQLLNSLQNGGTVSDPALLPYAQQVQIVQERDKVARQNELADFISKNQYQTDQNLMLELARNGVAMPFAAKPSILEGAPKPPEPIIPGTEPAPTEDTGTLTEAVKELAVTKPSSPLEAYAAKMNEEKQLEADYRNRQLTIQEDKENRAADLAEKRYKLDSEKAQRSLMKPSQDKLAEQAESIAKNKMMIEGLEVAINKAGDTGGIISPGIEDSVREKRLAFKAEVMGDTAAARRLAARQDLKGFAMEQAGEVRKGFPGAVDRWEMQNFLSVGTNTGNLPAQNRAVFEKLKNLNMAAEQSHMFVNELVKNGIPYQEALQAYVDYDRKEPLFITDQKTKERIINPVRLGVVPGSTLMPGTTPEPTPGGTPTPIPTPQKLGVNEFIQWKRQNGL